MDWSNILLALIGIVTFVAFLVYKTKFKATPPKIEKVHRPELQEIIKDSVAPVKVEVAFRERLKIGLSRSRSEVWGKLSNLFTGPGLDENTIESIEELLYSADIGTATVGELIEEVKKKSKEGSLNEASFKTFLFDFLKNKMDPVQVNVEKALYSFDKNAPKMTKVIMVVGVNGAGKTTTIGKLATKLRAQGATVFVGACDTFRAAAVDQLQVWCDRSGATMIRAKEGANPSGVGYDALQAAVNANADYCILDTAGRLHT